MSAELTTAQVAERLREWVKYYLEHLEETVNIDGAIVPAWKRAQSCHHAADVLQCDPSNNLEGIFANFPSETANDPPGT